MLRVGLTGGLGSGKSTVAGFFAEWGAHVISADEMGRALMAPGEPVYQAIVAAFGPQVVAADGALNRRRLAALAFEEGRLAELNRLVHPPVIAAQEAWMEELFRAQPDAVAIVESALVFEAGRDAAAGGTVPGWRDRFDRLVLVTAPEELKVARYVARMSAAHAGDLSASASEALAADARRRLSAQIADAEKVALADYVLPNDASLEELRGRAEQVWLELRRLARTTGPGHSGRSADRASPQLNR